MYLLLTDETNVKPSEKVLFFMYGGLIISHENLPALHNGIEKIRNDCDYQPGDLLKFDTRVRPNHVSQEKATDAKRLVLDLCFSLNCKFISFLILHDIIKNKKDEDVLNIGINHVVGRFNFFLKSQNDFGLVLIDRLPNSQEYKFLSNKFVFGLDQCDDEHILIDRILLFGSTCINASHAASAIDIVLGTFRFCVNDPQNKTVASEMLRSVTRMIWHERIGDKVYVRDKGLILRPKEIRVPGFKIEYDVLMESLRNLLKG